MLNSASASFGEHRRTLEKPIIPDAYSTIDAGDSNKNRLGNLDSVGFRTHDRLGEISQTSSNVTIFLQSLSALSSNNPFHRSSSHDGNAL